jgi:hypothetical protein
LELELEPRAGAAAGAGAGLDLGLHDEDRSRRRPRRNPMATPGRKFAGRRLAASHGSSPCDKGVAGEGQGCGTDGVGGVRLGGAYLSPGGVLRLVSPRRRSHGAEAVVGSGEEEGEGRMAMSHCVLVSIDKAECATRWAVYSYGLGITKMAEITRERSNREREKKTDWRCRLKKKKRRKEQSSNQWK